MPVANDANDVALFDLHIRTYRTYTKTITISGIATAVGYSVRLMIRDDENDTTALITLTSTPVAGIVLSSNGSVLSIALTISETQTSALEIEQGVWDLEVTDPSGAMKTYIGGSVVVHKSVTHS